MGRADDGVSELESPLLSPGIGPDSTKELRVSRWNLPF
jgi:hypothetical protein